MKNLFLLSTDKPSRIYLIKSNNKLGITSNNPEFTENFGSGTQNQHIYITSDEEIKDGDWVLYTKGNKIHYQKLENKNDVELANIEDSGAFKIILTTDQDLIKEGVQAIDDKFFEWFVQNPSCESVEILSVPNKFEEDKEFSIRCYKIIIPKEELSIKLHKGEIVDKSYPKEFKQECLEEFEFLNGFILTSFFDKQETLEEAEKEFEKLINGKGLPTKQLLEVAEHYFIIGYATGQERSYSEEDIALAFNEGQAYSVTGKLVDGKEWLKAHKKEWFENFKNK